MDPQIGIDEGNFISREARIRKIKILTFYFARSAEKILRL